MISRSIFHRNFCSVDACETDIYSQSSGNKIIVHRELLLLEPSQDLHIQCKAASPSHVSIFYNQVGQRVGVNTIILDSKIINENSLKNSSFVNEDLRVIQTTEIFLASFIIFDRHIQCLKETKLILNKVPTACHEMQVINLNNGFDIEANG